MQSKIIFIISLILLCSNRQLIFSQPQTGTEILEIEQDWQGDYCGVTLPLRTTITTQDEWTELWQRVHSLQLPIPDAPKIDFERYTVLAVFMGEQKSASFEIRISRIIKTENNILVEVVETKPPPESFVAMAITSPYHIALIKKYPLKIRFQNASI